jgi:cytochrome c
MPMPSSQMVGDSVPPVIESVISAARARENAKFQYSDALRASGITWNEGLLMKWLENPDAMVKGTDMEFKVSKAERA